MRRATFAVFEKLRNLTISIHALREEGDHGGQKRILPILNFYPRPPRGGRHKLDRLKDNLDKISIHALREEGDTSCRCSRLVNERFLSTPSARRATWIQWLLA